MVTKAKASATHPYIESAPYKFGPAAKARPLQDATGFIRWPKCVQLQRKKAVLLKKVKIPPAVNQFNSVLNKNEATTLFKLLANYRPETPADQKKRLFNEATNRANGGKPVTEARNTVVYGLNEVTKLIESKRAQLVVIANDVHPIELVCWIPALCQAMQVPYCIVKNKARLGAFVHQKNAAVLALEKVDGSDKAQLNSFIESIAPAFIDNADARRKWGN